ncbi:MAG: sugar ABC transporter substrate-binding protein [Spirochaetia bacterium]|nr:sugar ABC transporter substrate-binding protein [Spirochaetia bacterium]
MKKAMLIFVFLVVAVVVFGGGQGEDDGVVTLKYITLPNDAGENWKLMEGFEQGFYEEYPNIKIEAVAVPFADLEQKTMTAHIGGAGYDLILVNHPAVGIYVDAGVLEPLDSYAANSTIDMDLFNESVVSVVSNYKGNMYTIPFAEGARSLALNKAMFQEEGLDYPETMDEMLTVAKQLTKDLDGDGVIDQYGGLAIDFANMYYPVYEIGQWLMAAGGKLYDQDENGKWVATINSDGSRKFIEWSKEMMNYLPKDMPSWTGQMIISAFAEGKFAMFDYGVWHENEPRLQEVSNTFDLIDNPPDVQEGTVGGGWHLGMGADSEYKDEVWKVLEWLSRPENMAKSSSMLPPMAEAFNYPPFNSGEWDFWKQQNDLAALPVATIPPMNECIDIWNKYWQKAILGQISVTECLEGAEKDMNVVLQEYNKTL